MGALAKRGEAIIIALSQGMVKGLRVFLEGRNRGGSWEESNERPREHKKASEKSGDQNYQPRITHGP